MTVTRMWAARYRSLVDLRLDLHPVTVIQGENATGKTNLYRVLLLLSRGAAGALARTLLDEGGMPSALSANDLPTRGRKANPIRMLLGAQIDDISYEVALGLPSVEFDSTPFALDAEIKEEAAWIGAKRTRHSDLLDRAGSTASARDIDGATTTFATVVDRFEPALSQLGEPARFPELYELRERMKRWRFYHHIPTGPDALARAARAGVRTPVLADDGRDLAAALATIDDLGNGALLRAAVDDAFAGATLVIEAERGVFGIGLLMPGLRRPMGAHELSDGTLRYLSLIAALLTPRPPELLVLNEPETSLHSSLIDPLARLVNEAASRSQIVVTTHSSALASAISDASGYPPTVLTRRNGYTTTASQTA
jgi:predicted ATPase